MDFRSSVLQVYVALKHLKLSVSSSYDIPQFINSRTTSYQSQQIIDLKVKEFHSQGSNNISSSLGSVTTTKLFYPSSVLMGKSV